MKLLKSSETYTTASKAAAAAARKAGRMAPAPPPWPCPWCRAAAGEACTPAPTALRRARLLTEPTRCHPSRLEVSA